VNVLVGLGNPGPDYEETRHNIGFLVTDEIGKRYGPGRVQQHRNVWTTNVSIGHSEVLLARPRTYMNRSGAAVRDLLEQTGVEMHDLLIICDDLYLDFESIRLRTHGSHGGHNGLRSIIDHLGSIEFPRLRVGVGPAEPEVVHADFVLAPFSRKERERLPQIVDLAADCAEAVVRDGLTPAMNRYNRRAPTGDPEGSGSLS
jgi:PTH1 family peptidyl-tRNA hydrolase